MNETALERKALETLRKENMLPEKGLTVLVGVSGGADSMALLHFLHRQMALLGIHRLVAAHIHHGLRGEEADRDLQVVEEFCHHLQVPLYVKKANVADIAQKWGVGLEEAGRRIRYAFFSEIADNFMPCKIATAHTLSDNMETMLLHLVRGCDAQGMIGIPPVRDRVIRPLLDCSREDTVAYCRLNNLEYVFDSSNADNTYSRNRVRNCIVPELYTLNPHAEQAFQRLSSGARRDEEYFSQAVEALRKEALRSEHPLQFDCEVMRRAHPALLSRLLYREAFFLVGEVLENRHVAILTSLVERTGAIEIPGGVRAVSNGQTLSFEKKAELDDQKNKISSFETPLKIGGIHEICGRIYESKLLTLEEYNSCKKIHKILLKNALNYDNISSAVKIRNRMPGDSYHPVGRQGGKSLKKLFNEAKLSSLERASIPVLCDSEGILLVSGFGCDERVRIYPETKQVLAFYPVDKVNEGSEA